MTPERWERVKKLYDVVHARPQAEQASFLAEVCPDDELRRDVQTLLDQPISTEGFVRFVGGPAAATQHTSDAGPSLVGRQIGSFDVQALLGRGGMGDVYRAHDAKLRRDVAIKVLPPAFTADAGRLASLEREARVVASLNHPHIAAIHGVEESDGIRGLILELVKGDTLAERLAQSAGSARPGLRLVEALGYARQIADGLEAAHEKGITHRDLKPANIKITPDGVVKLLDFGIAKVIASDGPGIDVTQAPTATADGTAAGLIVGTVGYMSPEQARGKTVDKRTDIWAFGCLLYEMLSGRKAFSGGTLSDTIAAILERDPDWSTLPVDTPRTVRRLLQRCLEKDPKQRLRDIGDARVEIEEIIRSPAEGPDAGAALEQSRKWRRRTQLAATTAVMFALVSAGILTFAVRGTPEGDTRVSRFTVDLPEGQLIGPGFNSSIALSRDGTLLATTLVPGPVSIRRLDRLGSVPLKVTMPAAKDDYRFRGAPVFSPDGRFISFIEGNSIYSGVRPFLKAALSGEAAVKLADYDMFHGGDWAGDEWIYWTASYPGGIVRIRDSGGPIEPVTKLQEGERSHRFAHLLPGGQGLIYTASFEGIDSYDDARIFRWDLKTGVRKLLIEHGTSAVYSPSGHIVYARAGKLFAVAFDVQRGVTVGSEFEVLDGVVMSKNTGAAQFSLSARGDLAYAPGSAEGGHRTLVWVDRFGKEEPLPLKAASYLYPRIAPDGRSLAVEIEGPNHDFYFYDFSRTVLSRVTNDGMSHSPVWTNDGKRLAYRSWQFGGMTMWRMNADRSGVPERLDPSGTRQSPVSFSPDDKFLSFDQKDAGTEDDAWILPLAGTGGPRAIAHSRKGEGSAKFSPDNRWVAYTSDESGQSEVWVQPFPGLGPKIQISKGGGMDPVWCRLCGELYYRGGDRDGGTMMAVKVHRTAPLDRAFGPPTQLWRHPWEGNYSSGSGASCGMPGVSSSNYDVTPDGQRFLMVRDDDSGIGATKVVVVLNWALEVKALEAKAKERARSQAPTSLRAAGR